MLSTSRAALMTMTSTGDRRPQPPQDLQAGHVRQVDVEQDEVRVQPVDLRERLRAGGRRPDHLEAVERRHEPGVHLRDHEVVVDDQDADHETTTWFAAAGSR